MAILVTSAVQVARFANALYGVKIGSVTNAAVMEDISVVGLTTAVNSYYTSSFGSLTNAAVATSILGNLGLAGNAAAQAYVEAQLNAAGTAKGAAVLTMLNAFSNMTADATFGAAATAWNDKIVAARAYTVSNTADVTTDYSAPVTGTTFTLTTGIDNLTGTSGNDTFGGVIDFTTTANTTLQTLDSVTGGSGTDTLNVVVQGELTSTGVTLPSMNLSGVEKLSVNNAGTTTTDTLTVVTGAHSGVTDLYNDRSTGVVAFTQIGTKTLNIVGDGSTTNTTTSYTRSNGSSVTSAQTINVTGGTTAGDLTASTDSNNNTTSLTINSSGAANTLGTVTVSPNNTVTSLTINAATGLTATAFSGFSSSGATVTVAGASTTATTLGTLDTNITSVNASGLTASGVTATLGNATQTLTGGDGNDTVTVNTALTTGSVVGGAGVDTLKHVNSTALSSSASSDANFVASSTLGVRYSGFETYKLSSSAIAGTADSTADTVTSSQRMDYISGITTIGVSGATMTDPNTTTANDDAAMNFTFTEVASTTNNLEITGISNSFSTATNDDDLTVTVSATRKTNTTADAMTVTLGTSTAGAGSTAVATSTLLNDALLNITLSQEETINIVSQGGANYIKTLSGAEATTLNVSGAKALSIGAFSVANLNTINAGTATGALLMTIKASDKASVITGGSSNDSLFGGTGNDNISGGAGNDTIDSGNGTNTISGGDGNDNLTGGTAADVITGDAGADTISGGSGADNLSGGDGNDTFNAASAEFVGATAETVSGGDGTDNITFSDAVTLAAGDLINISSIESVIFANAVNGITLTDAVMTANGTTSFTVTGSAMTSNALTVMATGLTSANSLVVDVSSTSHSGADSIRLGAGNDTVKIDNDALDDVTSIAGGSGTDTLQIKTGGSNTSLVAGITGFENITFGTTTSDAYYITLNDAGVASGSTQTIDASNLTSGTIRVVGSAEADGKLVITGGAGDDTLVGGSLADTLSGGDGADNITGGSGADVITGGAGDNANLDGGDGNDSITGGSTNDTIVGGAGVDSVYGGDGNDTFSVALAADFQSLTSAEVVQGGAGTDKLSFVVDVSFNVAANDLTNISSIETIEFLGNASETVGITLSDAVYTANGNSTLTITANAMTGTDVTTIAAGGLSAGNNVAVQLTNTSNTAANSIVLGAGNDSVRIDNAALAAGTITGGSGTDTLNVYTGESSSTAVTLAAGVTGFETMTFGSATDFYNFTTDSATVASGATLTVSGAALTTAFTFVGSAETNGYFNLISGIGADSLVGGTLADTISAGSGADTITGGLGADSLTGGAGADVFIFAAVADSAGTAVDSITDWTTGEDKLQISLNYASQSAALDIYAKRVGAGAADVATVQDGLSAQRGQYQYITGTSQLVVNFNNDNLITTSDYKISLSAASTASATVVESDVNFSITGGSGSDSIVSGSGADTINGYIGTDTIDGGAGNDVLALNFANVTSNAVTQSTDTTIANIETIAITGNTAVTVTLTGQTEAFTITASGSGGHTVVGGSGNDTITGSTAADSLVGGSGVDSITGGTGSDSLTGGAAADYLDADVGTDRLYWTATTAALFAAETGSTAGAAVTYAAGSIGDTITSFTSASDKFYFAAAGVTNAIGTEVDTLVTVTSGGTVTNAARFVEVSTSASDAAFATHVTLLDGLTSTAVAIADSFIAFVHTSTDGYLYYVKQVSSADTIAAQDVTLIGKVTGVTDVANGDFVSF